jgi:hypothetical protein
VRHNLPTSNGRSAVLLANDRFGYVRSGSWLCKNVVVIALIPRDFGDVGARGRLRPLGLYRRSGWGTKPRICLPCKRPLATRQSMHSRFGVFTLVPLDRTTNVRCWDKEQLGEKPGLVTIVGTGEWNNQEFQAHRARRLASPHRATSNTQSSVTLTSKARSHHRTATRARMVAAGYSSRSVIRTSSRASRP